MNKIDVFVIGSANVDQTVLVERMPIEGETVAGLDYQVCCGGKGANQAVAAVRAGAKTAFLGCIGNDDGGKLFRKKFEKEKIQTDYLYEVETSTGVALINLTTDGSNSIVVYSGANGCIEPKHITDNSDVLYSSKIVLLQNEISEQINIEVAKVLSGSSARLVLNPAPARELSLEMLKRTDLIIPNQTEAELITGVRIVDKNSLTQCVDRLHEMGLEEVIITLGGDGCVVSAHGRREYITPPEVKVVNTIGAGDCFCGVLCALLSRGEDIFSAAGYAVKASSISVCRNGAMDSMPYLEEFNNSQS